MTSTFFNRRKLMTSLAAVTVRGRRGKHCWRQAPRPRTRMRACAN